MNLHYFKCQIEDEIEGAEDYLYKAIEVKNMNNEWSKNFYSMADMEKGHAMKLYSMMGNYYNKLTTGYKRVPNYLVDCMKDTQEYFEKGIDVVNELFDDYEKL